MQTSWIVAAILVSASSGLVSSAAEPPAKRDTAIPVAENKNSLILEYRARLKFLCSSYWGGWPADRAFDGNPRTSWFTAKGDAAAHGTKPWIAVKFPDAVRVSRVTLLSNREPPWEIGYTIRVGQLELLDADGKVLFTRNDELGGERPDMDIRPHEPVAGVRQIRFTSLRDEGDQNPYDDIAIGEILVE
jgi:hypothetical protein